MIQKKMLDALNAQLNEELASMYLYMAMGADLDDKGWSGMAHWMRQQAREEFNHFLKMEGYIKERMGRVIFQALPKPRESWKTPKEVFTEACAHEKKVTGQIWNLVKLARELHDVATEVFLHWFVSEQVEEESQTQSLVDKFEKLENSPTGMFQIDNSLSQRQ